MRKLAAAARAAWSYARLVWAVRRGQRPVHWPLLGLVWLTHRCNLACSYCDDGQGRRFPEVPAPELSTAQVLQVLRRLREVTRIVSFTGGECTLRQDFPEIAREAQALGFVTHLNTNGTVLGTLWLALPHLDALCVSLDTLDLARSDQAFGVGPGRTQRVLDNLAELAALRRGGARFDVVINAVIREETVEDVYDLLDYCWANDFGFTPSPYIRGCYPGPGLQGSPAYARLMDHLIALKRRGYPIEGTVSGLEGLRDFVKFDCVPMTLARVQPSGELYFPCNVLHRSGGSLLSGSYREAVEQGLARHGYPPPGCDNRCHMACYLDYSEIVHRPGNVLADGLYRGLGQLRRLAARLGGGAPFAPAARPGQA